MVTYLCDKFSDSSVFWTLRWNSILLFDSGTVCILSDAFKGLKRPRFAGLLLKPKLLLINGL